MFEYITVRTAVALVVAFFLTLLLGNAFIRALGSLRLLEDVDKPDSLTLAELHSKKKHTPTMGGIMIVNSILIATFLCADPQNAYVVMALFSLLSFAGLGLIDDYMKLRGLGRHQGLGRGGKLLGQGILAAILAMAISQVGDQDFLTHLLVPGTKMADFFPDLGWVYFLFFMVVMMGSSNAVNLTDGLDGLATGLTAMVALTFMVMAYAVGHAGACAYLKIPHINYTGELTIFCASMVGATLGFLWFNAHPARIFMGDTGSLALGGAVAFVALAIKQELVLLIAGGVFVFEALSVILQITSVKLTGRRIFRCAPFHHHLEFSGWNENHVVVRLWCVGIVLAAAGLATLKMH
jgi:phospho-N-acetylmuramoyl-pentapeptide-transferase